MSEQELKPCPFCGGEAQVRSFRGSFWRVRCKRCLASPFRSLLATEDEAIEVWNTRLSEASSQRDLQKIIDVGHNLDCMFCAFKDRSAAASIKRMS